MRTFILDAETYYADNYTLHTLTPAEYILDDRFELIGCAVKELGVDKPRWIEGPQMGAFLKTLDPAGTITISHNALFDNCIWAYRYGWVPARMVCTLGMARAVLKLRSNSLANVAKVLQLGVKGNEIGLAKGMTLSMLKARPEFYPAYVQYALNDIRLCENIYTKLIKVFPESEVRIQDLVLRCAIEPVLEADIPLLERHLEQLRKKKARLLRECDYEKAQLMSAQQFQAALEELGVMVKYKLSPTGKQIPAFARTDPFMAELQEYCGSPNENVNYRVQVLASARLAHKSTIEETRAEKFLNIARLKWPSGKPMLPVPLRYGGAHTHRLSGDWGMNLQNLPRDNSELRASLLAPEGHKIISADLSQIEARIVARICEQEDLLGQFARGEDVYALFAEKIFEQLINKKDNPGERFIGKTGVLSLQYGSGAPRFEQMVTSSARRFDINLKGLFDKNTAQRTVDVYRTAFSNIPDAWRTLDGNLNHILANGSTTQMKAFGPVWFFNGRIRLPNGLYLKYDLPDQSLYGARLLENITQALARNVIMEAALRIADRGYRFVLQSHDELVFVVPDAEIATAEAVIMEEMVREPEWLPALPLAAEIGVADNYGGAKS